MLAAHQRPTQPQESPQQPLDMLCDQSAAQRDRVVHDGGASELHRLCLRGQRLRIKQQRTDTEADHNAAPSPTARRDSQAVQQQQYGDLPDVGLR